jgi:hypothetical protein
MTKVSRIPLSRERVTWLKRPLRRVEEALTRRELIWPWRPWPHLPTRRSPSRLSLSGKRQRREAPIGRESRQVGQ